MIEKVTCLPQFDGLPHYSVPYARIAASAAAYGENAELYVQKNGGEITALMGGVTLGGLSLCMNEFADTDELSSFFKFFGCRVFCGVDDAVHFNVKKEPIPLLMFKGDTPPDGVMHGRIVDLYGKLCFGADGDIDLPDQDGFYADMCIRFNHLAAEYSILERAAAVCGFMTRDVSLVTGVAVSREYRNGGEGRAALMSLVSAVRQKYPDTKIFAAAREGNVGFYEKCGFERNGYAAVLNFKECDL